MSKKQLTQRAKLLESELAQNRERLDMLKQQKQAIVDAAKGMFTSDVFGGQATANFADMGLSASAYNLMNAAASPTDVLDSDIGNLDKAMDLLKTLRRRGLDGIAFQDLAARGDVDRLQQFVDMSRADLRSYERKFERRAEMAQQYGNYAGNAEFGPAIKEQTAEVRGLRDEQRETNRRLKHLEELAERNPSETGKHVAAGSDRASVAGYSGRVAL